MSNRTRRPSAQNGAPFGAERHDLETLFVAQRDGRGQHQDLAVFLAQLRGTRHFLELKFAVGKIISPRAKQNIVISADTGEVAFAVGRGVQKHCRTRRTHIRQGTADAKHGHIPAHRIHEQDVNVHRYGHAQDDDGGQIGAQPSKHQTTLAALAVEYLRARRME